MQTVHWFLQRSLAYFAPPFSSWRAFGRALASQLIAFNDLNAPQAWPYLLAGLLLGWLVYRRYEAQDHRDGFWRFMFPGELYRHRSAVADYKFVALDMATRAFVVAPLVSGIGWGLYKALQSLLPSVQPHSIANPIARGVLASIIALLIVDFVYYLAHYLMHHIPLLWHFHEVHHSAEVLTLVTAYRVHPLERLLNGIIVSLFTALAAIFYSVAFDREAHFLDLYGANVIFVFVSMLGIPLRHSHVWLSYGPIGNQILISPAQHQIHHSKDPKHWDKNYGLNFAFWDRMFGTLYVPRQRETIEFGVPDSDPADFSTVARLYLLPFAKAGRSAWRWTTRLPPLRTTILLGGNEDKPKGSVS
jgi:sterol desaturase/sphingolipid hydroxylase (fatty acid hydroxylase superfamily)